MANVDQTFNVVVDLKRGGVSRKSFGLAAFFGFTGRRAEKGAKYDDLDAVGLVYKPTDPEYKAAQSLFGQTPKPKGIVIFARASTVKLTPTAANDTAYTVRVAGTNYTYTSDGTATVAEITAGLHALINAVSGVTSVDNTTDVDVTVDGSAGEVNEVRTVTTNIAEAWTPTESWANALPRFRAVNDAWYICGAHTRVNADQQVIAAYISAIPRKQFVWQSSDATINTSGTTDIAAVCQASSYVNVWGVFHGDDTKYADMAAIGAVFAHEVGQVTAKFEELAGILPDDIPDTTYLDAKNVNYYIDIGVGPILQEGKVAVGEFIDVIRDLDWLSTNLRDDMFVAFKGAPKVGFTAKGIKVAESVTRARVGDAESREILDPADTEYEFPTIADTTAADRGERRLRGIKVYGRLVGAIHFVDPITLTVAP